MADAEWDSHLYQEKHAFVWKYGESLVELLAPKAGEAILDLGCGVGTLTAQIAAKGAAVIGLDSAATMLEEARRNYPHLRFDLGDARQLAYREQFDAVFSNAALHWIREAGQVVQGIAAVLKTGGRFVAEFGGHGNVQTIQATMRAAVRTITGAALESPWYFPTIGQYAALLEQHGLEVAFARLFDRPTPLDGPEGMRNWIKMFGGHFLQRLPAERQEDFFRLVEAELRPLLQRDGQWFADYRRLQVMAWKTGVAEHSAV